LIDDDEEEEEKGCMNAGFLKVNTELLLKCKSDFKLFL
jgi:hypothetical protein